MREQKDWRKTLEAYFPGPLRDAVRTLSKLDAGRVTELRVRAEQPLCILAGNERIKTKMWTPTGEDIRAFAQALLGHSLYARAEELRGGYVTLPGGSRAGLCGKVVLEGGRAHHMQDFSSIALRIARPVPGAADALMPYLVDEDKPVNALIFSAPGHGKTTALRDIARQYAENGYQVGIVDERSELAACMQGVPQLDVGPSTDVLDACPKAEGMVLMVRVFAPDILVTDEIGRSEDAGAIEEATRCGVAVVASAHAGSIEELMNRPIIGQLLRQRSFQRYILLGPNATLLKAWNEAFGILYQT